MKFFLSIKTCLTFSDRSIMMRGIRIGLTDINQVVAQP
jgi:hypothetical protein